jgi:hypothetical protein
MKERKKKNAFSNIKLICMECTKAYVVRRRSGRMKETCLKTGESKGPEDEIGPLLSLNIEEEFGLLEKTQLTLQGSSSASTSSVKDTRVKRLKELGLERLVTRRSLL